MSSATPAQCDFIQGLYAIVNQEQYQAVMRWDNSGTRIVIPRTDTFCEDVLPLLCHAQSFASFIRQMNMYGFQKRRIQESTHESGGAVQFTNPNFIRGRPELLKDIHRKRDSKRRRRHDKDQHLQLATSNHSPRLSSSRLPVEQETRGAQLASLPSLPTPVGASCRLPPLASFLRRFQGPK